MATNKLPPKDYENNPFFIASNGFTLLFNMARGVGVFLLFLSLFAFIFSYGINNDDLTSAQREVTVWHTSDWAIAIGTAAILGLAFVMIASLFNGIAAYTAVQLSKGKRVSFNEAFNAVFERLWSYIWLKVIISIKLLLWYLLLIVPGIIMSVRYSLADLAFFDERKNLRGNAAIKESLRLTKGAWLTTFAASTLFNLLTFGSITYVVTTAANAMLYKQFDTLGDKKPDAHWLSWFTVLFPIVFVTAIFMAIVLIVVGIGLVGRGFYS